MGLVKKIVKGAGIILFGLYALERCHPEEIDISQKVEDMYLASSIERSLYAPQEHEEPYYGLDAYL